MSFQPLNPQSPIAPDAGSSDGISGRTSVGGARDDVGAGPLFQQLDKGDAFPYSLTEYGCRFLWAIFQSTLFRCSPRRAYGWRRMLLRMFGAQVGPFAQLRSGVIIMHPWLLEIGEWSSLADGVIVYNLGMITIGRHSTISQGTYLCAGTHDYTEPDLPLVRPPVRIGNGVWIAAQAFVGPGVTVGDNAVVGARSMVAKDVPPGMVVAGNPARVVKPRPMGGTAHP